MTKVMNRKIAKTLDARGFESEYEWEQYVDTIEKDGEVLTAVYDIHETYTLQVVEVAKELMAKIKEGAQAERGEKKK
ncbi:hypothetical protein GCK32_001472 [Trichostrongylus colubriformis]|uniref:Uncharacterized protein n=1 Tax=Trichostrongylus colubriformis TaxID=6319 RepID=A0AAN8IH97_TRICO